MIYCFRSSPTGWTDLVFAIYNQKGHTSQVVMPKWLCVALLVTLTTELVWKMHPEISCPCKRTFMAGFWWSITVDPFVDSAKLAVIVT